MVARGSGHLLFMSSLAGKAGAPGSSVYAATKFGLRGFGLALREDLAGKGVGVSVVLPGFIRDAGMFADSGGKLPPYVGHQAPRGRRARRREGDRAEPRRARRRAAAAARGRAAGVVGAGPGRCRPAQARRRQDVRVDRRAARPKSAEPRRPAIRRATSSSQRRGGGRGVTKMSLMPSGPGARPKSSVLRVRESDGRVSAAARVDGGSEIGRGRPAVARSSRVLRRRCPGRPAAYPDGRRSRRRRSRVRLCARWAGCRCRRVVELDDR